MDNTKLPAYPRIYEFSAKLNGDFENDPGFTKQEKGALIMAAALVGKYNLKSPEDQLIIAQLANQLTKVILEEANK